MVGSDNVVSIGTQTKINLDPKVRQWAGHCKKIFATALFQRFALVLGHVDDTLFALADKADNNVDQSLYFDAMREVRKHRKIIEKRFQTRWLSVFESFWRTGVSPFAKAKSSADENEFSLIGDDDLEQNLAIDAMITKGETHYKDQLEALHSRISHMLHGMPVNDANNPFALNMIAGVYHEATKKLPIDIKVKLVLAKLFERGVVLGLEEAYQKVNDQLRQFGVLPQIDRKARKIVKSADAPMREPEHVVDQQIQLELFKSLQELLSMRRTASGAAATVSGPVYGQTQVLSALSSMQHDMTNYAGNGESMLDTRALLLSEVKKLQNGNEERAIGQGESDALDVVNMIFEFILEDRNLPDAMKALLSRLQIPMLKVSMLDKHFFSKKDHPARRLLNQLAQAGLGWDPAEGQGPNTLYHKMFYVVRRIIHEFDNSIALFDDLLKEFLAYTEKEGRFAERSEKRTTQITQGKEQLELAKLKAADEIGQRLNKFHAPEFVRELIEDGWKDVLLLVHLRKGLESEAWANATQVIDDLLWSVQPKEAKEDRQGMLRLIPSLLQRLREGLTDISYDPHKMAKLLKNLQVYHIDVLRGNIDIPVLQPEQVVMQGQVPESKDSDIEEIVLAQDQIEKSKVADDACQKQAETMAIGTWIEYLDESENNMRCKLSWKSEVTQQYIFVNRRGVKVAEMSLNGLASVLRRDTTLVLADVPLMDRAMSALMEALKTN